MKMSLIYDEKMHDIVTKKCYDGEGWLATEEEKTQKMELVSNRGPLLFHFPRSISGLYGHG